MNIQTVRKELTDAIAASGLTQVDFAAKHDVSYSYMNKFLREEENNPRYNTLQKFEQVIASEKRRGKVAA